MDNIKDDKYYLRKIISDLAFVVEQTKGRSQIEIESNVLLVDSIMFRIIQIAENNSKLSDDFKKSFKNVPWLAIKGMRNKIVHNYGVVDMSIVYDTVINWMPLMYNELIAIEI